MGLETRLRRKYGERDKRQLVVCAVTGGRERISRCGRTRTAAEVEGRKRIKQKEVETVLEKVCGLTPERLFNDFTKEVVVQPYIQLSYTYIYIFNITPVRHPLNKTAIILNLYQPFFIPKNIMYIDKNILIVYIYIKVINFFFILKQV